MKIGWLRFLIILLVALTFTSYCSYNSAENNEENKKPLSVVPDFPENHSKNISVTPQFLWHTEGEEISDVKYNLYLSKNRENVDREVSEALIARNIDKSHFEIEDPLDFSTKYFWKVVANMGDIEVKSDVWDFTTVSTNSNTENPEIFVSKVATIMIGESSAYDVAYENNLLYVGTDRGIYIMKGKSVIKRFAIDTLVEQIEVFDRVLYALLNQNETEYFVILDISDPMHPKPLDATTVNTENLDFFSEPSFKIKGNKIFLKDSNNVKIYEYNSKSKRLFFKSSISEKARDIAVLNNFIYVAEMDTIKIFDISDLNNPVKISEITSEDWNIEKVMVYSNKLFINTSSELIIMSLSDPRKPHLISKTFAPDVLANSMVFFNGRLYVAGDFYINIFDISDIASPKLIGSKYMNYVSKIRLINNYLYLTSSNNGVMILDSDLKELDHIFPYSDVEAAILYDDTLYAYSTLKLTTVNLTPDLSASKICEYFLPDYVYIYNANDLLLESTILYLGNPLTAVDISKKCKPSLLFQLNIEGKFDVVGDYAYIASSDGKLYIAKLNGDSTPTIVGYVDINSGWINDITASSKTIYISTHDGILIVDASDPSSPQVVHTEEIFSAERTQRYGDYIYVITHDGNIRLTTFKSFSNQVIWEINELDLKDSCDLVDMEIEGGYIFILTKRYLHVVDLSNPENPAEVLRYENVPYSSNSMFVNGDIFLISSRENGVQIFKIEKR